MFASSLATFGIARKSASSRTIAPSCDTRYSRTRRTTCAGLPFAVCAACALDACPPANQNAAPPTTIALRIFFTNLSPTHQSTASLPHPQAEKYMECGALAPPLQSIAAQIPTHPAYIVLKRERAYSRCQDFRLSEVPISYIRYCIREVPRMPAALSAGVR